jgi:hypothetical protein
MADDADALQIDGPALLAALDAALAGVPAGSRLLGWLAGSGFDARPDLLDAGARRLPLLGMAAATLAPVRDAHKLFATAQALGIAHPEISLRPPSGPGWLVKDMASSGGRGVRRWHGAPGGAHAATATGTGTGIDLATATVPAPRPGPHPSSRYWQREQPGQPIGCLVLADGQAVRWMGVHELLLDPCEQQPYRFAGVVGPLALSRSQDAALRLVITGLVRACRLTGLFSVDGLLDGGHWQLLEINPRPSASLGVHERLQADTWPAGLLGAHVALFKSETAGLPTTAPEHCVGPACGSAAVAAPTDASQASAQSRTRPSPSPLAAGELIIYTPQALRLDSATLARWAARGDLHDIPGLPAAGQTLQLPTGAPLCSLTATGASPSAVHLALQQGRAALLNEAACATRRAAPTATPPATPPSCRASTPVDGRTPPSLCPAYPP